jgi:hypothetical protein
MDQRIKWYRRRPFYAALLITLVALAIPVAQGLAGSGSSAVAPVERHNDDCGGSQGKKVIGKTTYTRSGDTLNVAHRLSGADPGTNYYLYLYSNNPYYCSYIAYLGSFKVGAGGGGSKNDTVDVSGYRDFFVCDYNGDTGYYDCGLQVNL